MSGLDFQPVQITDYDRVYKYTSAYGENSCQHSPVSMYSHSEKYDDCVCISDGFLYTLRKGLCDDEYRVYLAPFGEGDLKEAYQSIIDDAHKYGKKVRFVTLTQKHLDKVEEFFPDMFDAVQDRDMSEYIYESKNMGTFAGGKLAKRRAEVHRFYNIFGRRACITRMKEEDIPGVLDFEEQWVKDNLDTHDAETIIEEEKMIKKQLEDFEDLHLIGAILWIDGVMKGFCYGTMVNEHCYDVIVEKGVRTEPHVYKVIRMESTRMLLGDDDYVNMEEDVGDPGLRSIKSAYKPDILLHKFVVTER